MPNQTTQKASRLLYPRGVTVEGSVVIGAVGAVGTLDAQGVSTVVRNSAGNYTITFLDKWAKLKGWNVQVLSTTAKQVDVQLYSEDVAGASAAPNVVVLFTTASSGAAADPPAGKMFFKFKVSDSDIA
jgi:hypothetical protein